MKKTIAVLLISVISIFLIVGCSTEESYRFEGNNLVMVDDRSFQLKNIPKNSAEETVMNDFLYSITGDFDSLQDNLADIEPHKISVKNEKEMFEDGIYIKSYVIHEISTLEEKEYNEEELDNGDRNSLYYNGWKEIVEEYKLEEYKIVNVEFTQTHSDKSNELGPQWGDGTYSRSFIVGKIDKDDVYKIFDFGMPQSTE